MSALPCAPQEHPRIPLAAKMGRARERKKGSPLSRHLNFSASIVDWTAPAMTVRKTVASRPRLPLASVAASPADAGTTLDVPTVVLGFLDGPRCAWPRIPYR